jgi:hypothetical protein
VLHPEASGPKHHEPPRGIACWDLWVGEAHIDPSVVSYIEIDNKWIIGRDLRIFL